MARIELESPVTGVVWKVAASVGDRVAAGDVVVVVESMKMEIPVEAESDGTVVELPVGEGDQVAEDDAIAVIEAD